MDDASRNVIHYLMAIEDVRAQLGLFVDKMRARPSIIHAKPFVVLAGSPFRVHRGEVTHEYISALCVGASVKHSNGNEVFWSVDVYWDNDHWCIEPSIEIDRDGMVETVRSFEVKTANTLAECLATLKVASERLRSHPDAVELLSPQTS